MTNYSDPMNEYWNSHDYYMDLNNGLWIFNPNKNIMSLLSIDNLSSSTNDRMLYDRGKYLTEFIDKSSDTSKEDISDLPSGNNVVVS